MQVVLSYSVWMLGTKLLSSLQEQHELLIAESLFNVGKTHSHHSMLLQEKWVEIRIAMTKRRETFKYNKV